MILDSIQIAPFVIFTAYVHLLGFFNHSFVLLLFALGVSEPGTVAQDERVDIKQVFLY